MRLRARKSYTQVRGSRQSPYESHYLGTCFLLPYTRKGAWMGVTYLMPPVNWRLPVSKRVTAPQLPWLKKSQKSM